MGGIKQNKMGCDCFMTELSETGVCSRRIVQG